MTPPRLKPHSLTGQSAWQDLLRLLKEDVASDIRGKPTLRKRESRGYWYDRYRLGDRIIERYIGEDSEDLRHRFHRHETLRIAGRERKVETTRLIRLLRSEGYLMPNLASGQILMAMSRAGIFRLGGTLVGTQAFRHYEGVLGVHISADQAAQTNDIDTTSFGCLSLTLQNPVEPTFAEAFSTLDFEPLPSLDYRKVWQWQQTHRQTLVEFLTPSFQGDEGLRDLPALGVSAQSLHFLDYLIANPLTVPLLYRDGALIQIPRPERYAIHKLIVSERWQGDDGPKARQDRAEAAFFIRVLAREDPMALSEAWHSAIAEGPSWREPLDAALKKLPEVARTLNGTASA